MNSIRFILLLLIGVLFGMSSLYIALKMGFAVGVSLVTVILMRGVESAGGAIFPHWKRAGSTDFGYFLAFTTGMSFSTVTLISTVLAALVLRGSFAFPMIPLIIWVVSLNVTGSLLAWNFRRKMVDVPFPSASAAAILVKNSEEERGHRPFWLAFTGSALWSWATEFWKWIPGSVFSVSLSPMLIGLGGMLGLGTALSFFLGGLFFFIPENHILGSESDQVWFSVSAIIVAVILDFLTPLSRFEFKFPQLKKQPVFTMVAAMSLSLVLFLFLFRVNPLVAVLSCAMVWPMAFIASKVTGETDVTPIGALGKLAILIFAWLPGSHSLMGLTGQVIGPAAASADFSSDLRCGAMLNCKPELQLTYQLAGAVIGPFIFIPVFIFLQDQIGSDMFPVPAAAIWDQLIDMLHKDWAVIPRQLQLNLAAGALLALIYHWLRRIPEKQLPSMVPFCIAVLLSLETTNAIVLGGFLGYLLRKKWSGEKRLLVWSGLLTGESILMILMLLK